MNPILHGNSTRESTERSARRLYPPSGRREERRDPEDGEDRGEKKETYFAVLVTEEVHQGEDGEGSTEEGEQVEHVLRDASAAGDGGPLVEEEEEGGERVDGREIEEEHACQGGGRIFKVA